LSDHPGQRYDLPASRILRRSQRYARQLASALAAGRPGSGARPGPEIEQSWLLDLVWLRLAEDRGILPPDFFQAQASRFPEALAELNQQVGFILFDPDLYAAWDSPAEIQRQTKMSVPQTRMSVLRAWDHELHLRKFWPAGMPIEVLSLLAEFGQPERQPGLYWTPAGIVRRLLAWTLPDDLASRRPDFTLLDPACGTGHFLLAALERLIQAEEQGYLSRPPGLFAPLVPGPAGARILAPARKLELFSAHLYGVEADEAALQVCRRALLLLLLEGESLLERTPLPAQALFQNLRQGDSLVEQPIALQESLFRGGEARLIRPFHFTDPEQGFGKIMGRGGFDALAGNPPWAALKGKHLRPPYPTEVVDYFIRRYRTESFRPSLFEVFIRRSLELVAEGGRLAVVVPERLVSHPHFLELRRFLAEQAEVLELHEGEPFPGVAEPTVCLALRKGRRPRPARAIPVTGARGPARSLSLRQWLRSGTPARPGEPSGSELEQLLTRIEKAGKPLAEFLHSGVGLIARPGQLTPERASARQLGVVRGEHVHPYFRQGRSYLEFTGRNLAGGTRKLDKLTRRDRILVRKIGARLAATTDDSGDLVVQSLYFLFLRERRLCRGYDLRYFLGILNSRLLSFYYRHRLARSRTAAPQLQKALLDRLPIPALKLRQPAEMEKQRQLVALVEKRLQAGASPAPELEAEIERQAGKLYGLEEREVEAILQPMLEA
jgi:hypothetical protein